MSKINQLLILCIIFTGIAAGFFHFKSSEISVFYYKVQQDYSTYEINDIKFHVHPSISVDDESLREVIKETDELGDKIYKSNKKIEKLSVFITLPGDRAYDQQLDIQTMGAYLPNQQLIMINGQYNADIYSTFVHEYSHYLMHEYLKEHNVEIEILPEWFWEGTAYTFEYLITNHIPFRDSEYFTALPFQQLEKSTELNTNTIYNQGFYTVINLMEQHGVSIINQLLEETIKSSFEGSWNKLIDKSLNSYHEKFEIRNDVLRQLGEKETDPNELINFVLQINEHHGEINVYTPFSSSALIKAYGQLEQWELAKAEIEKYQPFVTNPGEYIEFAKLFKEDAPYKEELLEKGAIYAEYYGFDVMQYQKEANSIKIKD